MCESISFMVSFSLPNQMADRFKCMFYGQVGADIKHKCERNGIRIRSFKIAVAWQEASPFPDLMTYMS